MENKINEMNLNLNINQINSTNNQNQNNQKQDKPHHHTLSRNASMNNIYGNQFNSFSYYNNNGVNMTQSIFQYNFNTMNFNQNSNPFFNNNNQTNFMNNSLIMNMNFINPLNYDFNLNNNTKGLRRQKSATNLIEIKDVCPNLNEEKKLIIFERNDKKQYKAKVPKSLRMVELYYVAIEFKINRYSKMELFHNDKYLKEDDSHINFISNGDKVIIAENLDELNFSYYKNVYQKNLSSNIINIIFKFSFNNKSKTMTFSKKTRIREMFKMFFQENKILGEGKKYYKFLLDSKSLNVDDDSPIENKFFSDNKTIIVDEVKEMNEIKGKKLEVDVRNRRNKLFKTSIGTFNQIKDLYYRLEQNYLNRKIIQRITIKGKELIRGDERTFFSINVRDNFKCIIHFTDDDSNCIIF